MLPDEIIVKIWLYSQGTNSKSEREARKENEYLGWNITDRDEDWPTWNRACQWSACSTS